MNNRTSFNYLLVISILTWPFALQGDQEFERNPPLNPKPSVDNNAGSQQKPKGKPVGQPLIQYIPPPLDKPEPTTRVVPGGTRSAKLFQPIHLTLLTPYHTGHTIKPQPMLYWYLSKGTDLPVVFTLTEIDGIKPLIEKKLSAPLASGFHSISIAHYGVELASETTYEWSISILQDKVHELPSAKDIIAKAFVKRIPEKTDRTHNIAQSDSITRAKAYAKHGLWYDAFESLMETPSTSADHQAALNARSNLLEQVGLTNFK